MKKTVLYLALLLQAIIINAQQVPHTFQNGQIIDAEQMNENFNFLKSVASGEIKETTVDCTTGTINEAISKGFNSIVIKGTCTENLNYHNWYNFYDESNPARQLSYLKLAGFDSDAKIVAESDSLPVILTDGATLVIDNLTIQGGMDGISGYRNANVLLSGVTVIGFTRRGIQVGESSYLGVDEGGLTITTNQTAPADMDQFGIRYVTGSSGWLHTVEISNVRHGIAVYGGSMTYAYSFNIHDVETAIRASASSFLKYGEGDSVIENTSDIAIRVYTGTFTNWGGSLRISGLSKRALEANLTALEIVGLTVTGNPDTGEDLITIHNSKFRIVDLDLIDSGRTGLRIEGSEGQIRNATVANSQEHGLQLRAASVNLDGIITISKNNGNGIQVQSGSLALRNSTISENKGRGLDLADAVVDVDNVSITKHPKAGIWGDGARVYIEDSTISENNLDSVDNAGVDVLENAQLNLRNTIVSNNNQDGIHATKGVHVSLYENNVIKNNTGRGIYLNNNASIQHGWGSIIENNQGAGIYMARSSSGDLNNLQIYSNKDNGIEVTLNSSLSISDVDIQKNSMNGINISNLSSVEAGGISISENLDAININTKSSIHFAEDVQIFNNQKAALRLDRNADASFHQTTTSNISNNPNGILLDFSSVISFHYAQPNITDDIKLGKNTQMFFFGSNTTKMTGEIKCWTLNENNERSRQLYNYPVIEFQQHQGDLLIITDSNCGVWHSEN